MSVGNCLEIKSMQSEKTGRLYPSERGRINNYRFSKTELWYILLLSPRDTHANAYLCSINKKTRLENKTERDMA